MTRAARRSLLLWGLLVAAACGAPGPGSPDANAVLHGLDGALWVQTSVEYRAVAEQAYQLAALRLEEALADPAWTAALEQTGPVEDLPPAVVLDVDETVLDNSPYQARLILEGREHSPERWGEWAREAAAEPVPGALEFCKGAAARGVRLFYVTNRDAALEEATRRNLTRLGFPVSDDLDVVLTRGERPEWATADKGPRRAAVAARHRILLLVGDDMNDFVSESRGSPQQRRAVAAAHADRWGRRWIVLPNPQYGSWQGALLGFEYDLPGARRLQRKLEALDPRR